MSEEIWYFNEKLKPTGPISTQEIRAKILRGEIGPSDLICRGSRGDWKPASDWGVFEVSLFPASQGLLLEPQLGGDIKEWVLLVPAEDGKSMLQEGPFSTDELCKKIQRREVAGQQYAWKAGLTGWCRLVDRPEFSGLC